MSSIIDKISGTANIRLSKIADEQYEMIFELSQGTDRSMMQEKNPHIVFSDSYNNLLSFTYFTDISVKKNFAYVLGKGEGEQRKRTTFYYGNEPEQLNRYEVYVDAKDISDEENQPVNPTTADDYVYIIENDTVKLIFYKGTEKRIQIPSEIEGKPVTEIDSTCFTYSSVEYVIIPETVEKIY